MNNQVQLRQIGRLQGTYPDAPCSLPEMSGSDSFVKESSVYQVAKGTGYFQEGRYSS